MQLSKTHHLAPVILFTDFKNEKEKDELYRWAREFDGIARMTGDWHSLCARARYLNFDPEGEQLPCEIVSRKQVHLAAAITQCFLDFAMPTLEQVIDASNLCLLSYSL